MTDHTVRSDGHTALTIRVASVRFTCGNEHEWVWTVDEIRAAPDTAEGCPECGETAVDAGIESQTRALEQRGVVIDASFPRATPEGA